MNVRLELEEEELFDDEMVDDRTDPDTGPHPPQILFLKDRRINSIALLLVAN